MKRLCSEQIDQIINYREDGLSISEISHLSQVSKSTVLRYIQGIDIKSQFQKSWAEKRGGSRKRKLLRESLALEDAQILVSDLSDREKLLFLSALYWAEGNKQDCMVTNSDPRLIYLFISLVQDILQVQMNRIQISIRIFEDMDEKRCLDFWSKVTGISQDQFRRVHILSGKKQGKLEYGLCRVRIKKGSDILTKIKAVNQVFFDQVQKSDVPIAQMDRAPRS